jgi:hypothetical protein
MALNEHAEVANRKIRAATAATYFSFGICQGRLRLTEKLLKLFFEATRKRILISFVRLE